MRCPHCDAQWYVPDNYNIPLKECPFCNGNMRHPDQTLLTIEDVLKEIVSRYGVEILRDGNELLSLFADIAPLLEKEATLLRFFVSYGGNLELFDLQGRSLTDQNEGYLRELQRLIDQMTEVCNSFLSAMDIQMGLDKISLSTSEYDYKELADGTIELTFYKNTLKEEIIFPERIDGKKVTRISGNVFGTSSVNNSNRNIIKSIIIPEGVTAIGSGAFYGCKSLNCIKLPQSLITIEEYVFRSCKSLTSIVLPDSLEFIGKGAFAGSNITSIVLPKKISTIMDETFKNCKCLSEIEIPNSIKVVGKEAFAGCRSIVDVSLFENLEKIDDKAFQACKSLVNVSLLNGAVAIGCDAFADCESLKSINLPDSISFIGSGAFSRCLALGSVVLSSNITVIEENVFYGCRSLSKICIPNGVTSIRHNAFYLCESLSEITIPSSVTRIYNDAFTYCKGIKVRCFENSYACLFAKKKKWNTELLYGDIWCIDK